MALGAIVLLTFVAYANSFRGAFVFDDRDSILENESLRGWTTAFSPPLNGTTVSGRPVLNATLALNYAFGGDSPWGYHAVNLLIHVAAALVLFGLVRRTLRQPAWHGRFDADAAVTIAACAAGGWAVHPLPTEAVTYVVQRAESLTALLMLLMLYGSARALTIASGRGWQVVAWLACLAGAGTKEIAATAPLLVVLYDRAFGFESWRAAFGARWRWYTALACTWLLAGALVVGAHGRAATAGFEAGVSWPSYFMTQAEAWAIYAARIAWPAPLVFDYGTALVTHFSTIAIPSVAIAAAIAAVAIAWRRHPATAFAGVFAIVVLAPTTLVPIATQTIAEHRMYLPAAAIFAAVMAGGYALLGRRLVVPVVVGAWVLALATAARNATYRSEFAIWTDAALKRPDDNARARFNLGRLLTEANRLPEAVAQYRKAVQIDPQFFDAQNNLGTALMRTGAMADAVEPLRAAVRLRPALPGPWANLANALLATGQLQEAKSAYAAAIARSAKDGDLYVGLGRTDATLGDLDSALRAWQQALQLKPDNPAAHTSLAIALSRLGRSNEALEHFQAAARLSQESFDANFNLGNALLQADRWTEAVAAYRIAERVRPDVSDLHVNCGGALAQLGRWDEAIAEYEAAARLEPGNAEIQRMLARLRALRGPTPP